MQSQHACIHSNNTTPFAPSICSLVHSSKHKPDSSRWKFNCLSLFCFLSSHLHFASHLFILHTSYFTSPRHCASPHNTSHITHHITSILSHHHPGLEREADHIRSDQIISATWQTQSQSHTTQPQQLWTTTTTLNNDNSELQRQLCRTGKEKRKMNTSISRRFPCGHPP